MRLVQHRHPVSPSRLTLFGSQVARLVYLAFSSTRLAVTCQPPAILAVQMQNGVNDTALTLLVERKYKHLPSRVVMRYLKPLACALHMSVGLRAQWTAKSCRRCRFDAPSTNVLKPRRDGKELMHSATPTAFGTCSNALSYASPFHQPAAHARTAFNAHSFGVGFGSRPAFLLHETGRWKDQKGCARRL